MPHTDVVRADSGLILVLFIGFITLVIFFPIIALMSVVIYPLTALIVFGFLKIIEMIKSKVYILFEKAIIINLSLLGMTFAILVISFIVSRPSVHTGMILQLISFPVVIIGFAGIIKGILVRLYSRFWRGLNLILGVITCWISLIGFLYTNLNYLLQFSLIIGILILNLICRTSMYLSEFDLSLNNIASIKLIYYIVNNYPVYNERFSALLTKAMNKN